MAEKSSKPKILMIGAFPPPYHGTTIYFHEILNSKLNNSFLIRHLDTSDHRDLSNLAKFEFQNCFLAIKNIFQLMWILIYNRFDIIYLAPATSFWPFLRDGLFIIISGVLSRSKIVIHLHGGRYFRDGFYSKSNFLVKIFIRLCLINVDTAIVLGESLIDVFSGLVKNTVVLPNGVNVGYLKNKNKNKVIEINYLGNLFESKGICDFIEAANIILKEKDSVVKFNLAGEWDSTELETKIKVTNLLRLYDLSDKLTFKGRLLGEEKDNFLLSTDIFVFPTWYPYEGMPLVILEAMAAGCPIVSCTGVGVIDEVVLDGKTGILVEKRNIKQLVEAISKLIDSPELRNRFSLASRKRFEENYSLDLNIDRLITIFNKILA